MIVRPVPLVIAEIAPRAAIVVSAMSTVVTVILVVAMVRRAAMAPRAAHVPSALGQSQSSNQSVVKVRQSGPRIVV